MDFPFVGKLCPTNTTPYGFWSPLELTMEATTGEGRGKNGNVISLRILASDRGHVKAERSGEYQAQSREALSFGNQITRMTKGLLLPPLPRECAPSGTASVALSGRTRVKRL